MSIVDNPITLTANKFIASLTNLILQMRFSNNLVSTQMMNGFTNSCRIGNVDFGEGIVYTYDKKLLSPTDLTETSSLLTVAKSEHGQETIKIDTFKKFQVSLNSQLLRTSFTNGNLMNYFMSQVLRLLNTSADNYFYNEAIGLYKNWTPTQATQTIEVEQYATTGLTGADLEAVNKMNASKFAKVLRKTINNLQVKQTGYTDLSDKETMLTPNESVMKLVVNDTYWTDFLADNQALLFNNEIVRNMIPFKEPLILPESIMSDKTDVIAYLSERDKFAIADFYRLELSFQDVSTLITNTFLHIAYGKGVFKHMVGIIFKKKEIALPASLQAKVEDRTGL